MRGRGLPDCETSPVEQRTLGRTGRRSPPSASARGSSAPTGATSARPPRSRCSTPPPRPASRSSTPPTSTATAAASRSSAGSCRPPGAGYRGHQDGPPGPAGAGEFTSSNFRAWTDRSRRNLGVDTLDLVQLHCPPTAVFAADARTTLSTRSSPRASSPPTASASRPVTGAHAIARPGVASVQIILNAFRLKPLDEVLPAAQEAGVGIIARVPLASGLLSGSTPTTPPSPRTITGPTTATAARSTWARPSPASTSRRA